MAKKVLIFLMCISMFLASVPAMAEASESENEYTQSKTFIESLGVSIDNLFECDEHHSPITRAEMAKYVIALLNIDKEAYGFVQSFSDVSETVDGADEIHICHSLGILSGYGDSTFRPYDSVSSRDALKIIVCALGYEQIAQAKGGYPSGYLAQSAELGLSKGVRIESDSSLCKHMMAKIFENALFAPMAVEDVNGGKYTIDKNVDTLFLRHGIYQAIGKVTGNEFSTLTTKQGVGEGKIRIGDETYKNPKHLSPIIGSKITYYYVVGDDNITKELVHYTFDPESVLTLQASQIVDYDNNTLYYVKGDSVKEKKISKDSDVIYNNSPSVPLKKEYLTPKTGNITLIDNDFDGVCDTVVCRVYDNYVVQSVDPSRGIIFDRYDNDKSLTIKDGDEFCKLYDASGILLSPATLTQWDIVTAYASDDGKIVDAYVTAKEVEGVPREVGEEDGKRFVIIDTKTYYIANSYKGNIILGENALFYLDMFGDVAAVRSIRESEFEFGYLLGAKPAPGTMNSGVIVKILEIDGYISVFLASDKIFADDVLKKTADEKINALNDMIDDVVWYSLDKDGNVNKIYSPKGNAFSKTWSSLKDEDGNKIPSPTQITYRTSAKILDGKVAFDENTKVFLIPNNGEESLYRVSSPAFTDGLSYSMDAYKINDDTIVSDVLVQYYDGISSPINGISPVLVVESVTLVKNEDGLPVQKITGFVNGYHASYETSDENVLNRLKPYTADGNTYKAEKGDMIRFARDSENKIREAEIIYKAKTNTLFASNPNSTSYFQGTRVSYSQVYKANGGFMMLTPGLLNAYENQSGLEIYNVSSSRVYRYDTQRKEVSMATGKDIRGFVNEGSNASKVIVWTISANPSVIYIID